MQKFVPPFGVKIKGLNQKKPKVSSNYELDIQKKTKKQELKVKWTLFVEFWFCHISFCINEVGWSEEQKHVLYVSR